LGFPCNQFGEQEPDPEPVIKKFVTEKYNVTFPMFSKIEVNGPNTHPVYQFLKTDEKFRARGPWVRKGVDVGAEDLGWNFEKFLVGRDGKTFSHYEELVKPFEIEADILSLLDKQ